MCGRNRGRTVARRRQRREGGSHPGPGHAQRRAGRIGLRPTARPDRRVHRRGPDLGHRALPVLRRRRRVDAAHPGAQGRAGRHPRAWRPSGRSPRSQSRSDVMHLASGSRNAGEPSHALETGVTGIVILGVAVVVAVGFGLFRRVTDGRFGADAGRLDVTVRRPPVRARLPDAMPEVALGERATLVQFSSAFCAPCRTTRVVLADVATREARRAPPRDRRREAPRPRAGARRAAYAHDARARRARPRGGARGGRTPACPGAGRPAGRGGVDDRSSWPALHRGRDAGAAGRRRCWCRRRSRSRSWRSRRRSSCAGVPPGRPAHADGPRLQDA